MFSALKFVEDVLSDDLQVQLRGVRSLDGAPKAFKEFINIILAKQENTLPVSFGVDFFFSLQKVLCIVERNIPCCFTQQEMQQGKSMHFHPTTGDPLEQLSAVSGGRLVCWKRPEYRGCAGLHRFCMEMFFIKSKNRCRASAPTVVYRRKVTPIQIIGNSVRGLEKSCNQYLKGECV